MGSMTRAQLLTQGGLAAAQDEDVGTFVRDWLDEWLERTAKSWPWPCLKLRIQTDQIAAGQLGITVGAGEGGTDYHLHQLLGGYLFWYTPDKSSRGKILVRQLTDGDPDRDESTTNAANRMGLPTTAKLRVGADGPGESGVFSIYLDPVPNRTIILAFDAHVIPDPIGSDDTTDSQRPWYPNNKTLQQAVKCAFMELDDGAEGKANYVAAMEHLERMVIADRDFDGSKSGDNDMMQLDASVFR